MNSPKLLENISVLKSKNIFNVYAVSSKIYFLKVDKSTTELRSLNKKYWAISSIGYRFGLLGGLLIVWPASSYYQPRIRDARQAALDMLRTIDASMLDSFESFSCDRHELIFEEKKKDRYKVHIGKDWLLMDGETARTVQTLIL